MKKQFFLTQDLFDLDFHNFFIFFGYFGEILTKPKSSVC